ncbi:hypothetical protein Ancab_032051 [Ancistrocladus abbreviatus]
MGKHTEQKHDDTPSCGAPIEKMNPNRKWHRMLHVLDYHRWHYAKKMLANKKHGQGRNVAPGADINELDVDETDGCGKLDTENPHAEEKMKGSNSSRKGSRAARIRAMIAKEVAKKRGRHRRSSTCPEGSHLIRNNLSHHSEQGLVSEAILHTDIIDENDETLQKVDYDVPSRLEKCEFCRNRSVQIECHLGNNKHLNQQINHLVESNLLCQESSDKKIKKLLLKQSVGSADHQGTSASSHQPKELLDAMDVLSLNKEFFLKVLEDPESSLAQNFFAQTANHKRRELTKCGSFPVGDSSGKKGFGQSFLKRKHKMGSKENSSKLNISSPISANPLKNGHDSQAVVRHFKGLREKIRHVIRESRQDRHRITMDAVLHKVPYGQKLSEAGKDSPLQAGCYSPCNKDKRHAVRRSPSLDGSLDRYRHLFETSCNIENKHHNSERLRLRTEDGKAWRSIGRMYSSPDLEIYLAPRNDGSNDKFSSKTRDKTILASTLDGGHKSFNERIQVTEVDKESGIERSGSQESLMEPSGIDTSDQDQGELTLAANDEAFSIKVHTDQNVEILNDSKMASCQDHGGNMLVAALSTRLSEPDAVFELNFSKQGDIGSTGKFSESEDSESEQGGLLADGVHSFNEQQEFRIGSPTFLSKDNAEKATGPLDPAYSSEYNVYVGSKHQADFKYVRDILQISGYTGNQLLGSWYSAEQPVDPSVFVEFESCSLVEPDCLAFEENTQCNHLLLFDLINEVLLAIYERSVTYWPNPLSSASRIHPMPRGYHVLEEVWASISWYLSSRPELDPSLDYATSRDLAKDDGWMNLQFDAECVGLELEDFIFDDLLKELIDSYGSFV